MGSSRWLVQCGGSYWFSAQRTIDMPWSSLRANALRFSCRLAAFANANEVRVVVDSKTQNSPDLARRKAVNCNRLFGGLPSRYKRGYSSVRLNLRNAVTQDLRDSSTLAAPLMADIAVLIPGIGMLLINRSRTAPPITAPGFGSADASSFNSSSIIA